MAKPTFVLLASAWHTPEHYQPFAQRLHQAGYPTASKQLPSVGSDEPRKQTVAVDADFVRREILLPEIEQGKDLVVVMHSYAGWPGGAAVKGLSKKERNASGLGGGVVGLIFVAAFVGHEGQSITGLSPTGKPSPWCRENEETGQLEIVEPPAGIFYTNVTDPSLVEDAIKRLKLQSYASFDSPSPPPGWSDEGYDGRRAYVFTHQDKAFPVGKQKWLVEKSGKTDWRELDLESDHAPFLSLPEPLLKFMDELAQEWTQ